MRELEIEQLNGTGKGVRHRFGAHQVRITIGRDPQCDLVLSADETRAGLEHLDLVREAGRYQLRVNTRDRVTVNGRIGIDGLELEESDVLELGGSGGPQLRVHYLEPAQEHDEDALKARAPDEATLLRRLERRSSYLLGAAIVLAASLFAVTQRMESSESHLLENIASLTTLADRSHRSEPPSFADVIARTTPSVYLVLTKGRNGGESPVGTAWVVASGLLATNAHVASVYEEARKARQKLVVRAAGGAGADHEIVGVTVHPAYAAFNAVWQEYSPRVINAAGAEELLDAVPGYDVALLKVAEGTALPPALPIASGATLEALKPGEPIAFVGFPMERLVQLDLSAPNPVSQVASVVGITTFTLVKPLDGSGQLIEHSLPATGGASGSPIVNGRGEVVAMLSAINVLTDEDGRRFSNPAEINFAQRADVLYELLRGPETIDLEALRAAWRRDLGRYQNPHSAADIVIAAALAKWSQKWGDAIEPRVLEKERLTIDGSTRVDDLPAATHEIAVHPGHYLIVAVSPSFRDIGAGVVQVTRSGAAVKPTVDVVGVDRSRGNHPMVAFDVDRDATVTLIVLDQSAGQPAKAAAATTTAPAPSDADVTVYFVPPQPPAAHPGAAAAP